MERASELFESTLSWLQTNYWSFQFYVERDVVWTIQTRITTLITEHNLPYKIFNDYPLLEGKRRGLSADLVILGRNNFVEVAAEFKYEPLHKRGDIPPNKFPVVEWEDNGVRKDIKRIHEFVAKRRARVAYFVFIDEGGSFRKRPAHPRSAWIEWGNGVWVLYSQVEAAT